MLHDPVDNIRKLARFVGQPFLPDEEDAVNTANPSPVSVKVIFTNDSFRRGEAGDCVNHMTPDMARRLDAIMEEKLHGSGLSFS
uniref:Sulfotransferase n=1 Tax=Leersia perrieri TaxID=77586 RepID=A0A0D9WVG5_9ORYZ